MEILYIILCIPLYLLNSVCDKYISLQNNANTNIRYNIAKFAVGSLLLVPFFLSDSAKFAPGILLCGTACGILYAASKMLILTGYEKTSVSFMTFCHASGLLLPCIAGHFFWNETLTALSGLGIILIIVAVCFLKDTEKNAGKHADIVGVLLGLTILVTSGGVMILQKIIGKVFCNEGIYAYNFYSFFSAFLLLLPITRKNTAEKTIHKKVFAPALGSAVSLCVISLVMTAVTPVVPSYIMFPLFNGCGIIGVTLLSAAWFREKLTCKKALGVLMGLVGLFLTKL